MIGPISVLPELLDLRTLVEKEEGGTVLTGMLGDEEGLRVPLRSPPLDEAENVEEDEAELDPVTGLTGEVDGRTGTEPVPWPV